MGKMTIRLSALTLGRLHLEYCVSKWSRVEGTGYLFVFDKCIGMRGLINFQAVRSTRGVIDLQVHCSTLK
jgi:hypothetical protein